MKVTRRFVLAGLMWLPKSIMDISTIDVPKIEPEPDQEKAIRVKKAERWLGLYLDSTLKHEYKIGLGGNPVDDKTRMGDSCTPEGEFRIMLKNPWSSFYKSLLINYPLVTHAANGLRDGIIGRDAYERVVRAHRQGRVPDQYTALGGSIYIHGGGSGSDWTLGCVALDNRDIDVVYRWTPLGTKVIIEK